MLTSLSLNTSSTTHGNGTALGVAVACPSGSTEVQSSKALVQMLSSGVFVFAVVCNGLRCSVGGEVAPEALLASGALGWSKGGTWSGNSFLDPAKLTYSVAGGKDDLGFFQDAVVAFIVVVGAMRFFEAGAGVQQGCGSHLLASGHGLDLFIGS